MKIQITDALLKRYSINGSNHEWSKSFLQSIGVTFPRTQKWKLEVLGKMIDDSVLPPIAARQQTLTMEQFLE